MTDECYLDVIEKLEEQFDKTLNTTQRAALMRWLGGYHDDAIRLAADKIVGSENQKSFYLPATWKKYLPQQERKEQRRFDEPAPGTYDFRYSALALKILTLQGSKAINEEYAQEMLRTALDNSLIERVEKEVEGLIRQRIDLITKRDSNNRANQLQQAMSALG